MPELSPPPLRQLLHPTWDQFPSLSGAGLTHDHMDDLGELAMSDDPQSLPQQEEGGVHHMLPQGAAARAAARSAAGAAAGGDDEGWSPELGPPLNAAVVDAATAAAAAARMPPPPPQHPQQQQQHYQPQQAVAVARSTRPAGSNPAQLAPRFSTASTDSEEGVPPGYPLGRMAQGPAAAAAGGGRPAAADVGRPVRRTAAAACVAWANIVDSDSEVSA